MASVAPTSAHRKESYEATKTIQLGTFIVTVDGLPTLALMKPLTLPVPTISEKKAVKREVPSIKAKTVTYSRLTKLGSPSPQNSAPPKTFPQTVPTMMRKTSLTCMDCSSV